MTSLLPWLALGAVAYLVVDKQQKAEIADMAAPGSPQPLRAGVGYLFFVRLEATEEAARAVLAPKGVSMLLFGPATNPPFWAQVGQPYSTAFASFKATPAGNGSITLGDPFYGIGRLEKVVRLDGQPFTAEAPGESSDV
jgi:hypothetical protein